MTTVRKLLDAKGKADNYSVSATDTVWDALKLMAEKDIGAVLVAEGKKIVGIYTERDYLRKGELAGRSAKSTLVKDVMTSDMYTVTMDTSVEQCMALMEAHHIRHLPVVENNQLVGVVSIRDVMAAVLKDRESEIKGLENYIIGSGFAT
ncbi:MAG TPA: CBS domain-containing protein [Anaerolineales bacterium]|nr:CBS domain-containing protein [Anaerolineales bacterium]